MAPPVRPFGAERPGAVHGPREHHGHGDGDGFGHHGGIAWQVDHAGVGKQVKQPNVHDVGAQPHGTKLQKFHEPFAEGLALQEALDEIARRWHLTSLMVGRLGL